MSEKPEQDLAAAFEKVTGVPLGSYPAHRWDEAGERKVVAMLDTYGEEVYREASGRR